MKIDAHHHLWDLSAVNYPWLMEKGAVRFFGDPSSIQRNYLLPEFRADAEALGFGASVHIQVGAADPWAEAQWVQSVAAQFPDWPLVQVAFCDLTATDLGSQLDRLQTLPSVRGVRQIIGRAPGEDASTGTNSLLKSPEFLAGLKQLGTRGLSFDLQLLPELISDAADVFAQAPETQIALCHAGSPYDRTPQGLQRWADELTALSSLPHVCCKLSGLGMFDHNWSAESVAPIVSTCLSQFGAERCMFGSNFPVDSLTSTYADLVSRHQELAPNSDQEDVFRNTAKRFYRIG
ncbi:amidohydrolase family protein [Ruegeria sp.]|uniref:amidohydrolase family protein n=1 Tax=Ruegeria sp. TaxID=1879320 RepID=UPI003B59146C